MTTVDDLGAPVPFAAPARRVVSLVPSLTEAIAATRADALAGATDWCTRPAGLDVPRVRGTKNPDLAALRGLRPDVVVANQEENRELDVRRLRESGVAVWVTRTRTVREAISSLRRLFAAFGWGEPEWLREVARSWTAPDPVRARVAIPVWRDPWMVVGPDTFTGDLARSLGLVNVFADAAGGRYPTVTVDEIAARAPEVVLLPDEPYPFSASDGPEALAGLRCAPVSGRALTWYGPSLLDARATVLAALNLPR